MATKKTNRPPWWPKRMNEAEYQDLANSYGGVCLSCGELKHHDCEPDAENYPCDECSASRVMGAEDARLLGALDVSEESAPASLAPASDDADWRREQAIQAGMGFGVEGFNDAMGWGTEEPE